MGSLSFLGDKYLDDWYYWEMVIVTRKVLLMFTFLLFEPLFAVLLATGL